MTRITRRGISGSLRKCGRSFGSRSSTPKQALADPLGLPIGIQLYVVNGDLNKEAEATIKQIAAIGYKEVETAGLGYAKTASALQKILDDNGLKCPSAHLPLNLDNLQTSLTMRILSAAPTRPHRFRSDGSLQEPCAVDKGVRTIPIESRSRIPNPVSRVVLPRLGELPDALWIGIFVRYS